MGGASATSHEHHHDGSGPSRSAARVASESETKVVADIRAWALERSATLAPALGRVRAVVENVTPVVDGGRFPVKREVGDELHVEADVFADGHDDLACWLRWRRIGGARWLTTDMTPLGNDRWQGTFALDCLGSYQFEIRAAVDHYGTWARDARIRAAAGQDLSLELASGRNQLTSLVDQAGASDRKVIAATLERLDQADDGDVGGALETLTDQPVLAAARRSIDPATAVRSDTYSVVVERARARFGSWYELFPRSASLRPGAHGTFADVAARLPYVAGMGFDVLYLPPIHPVGTTNRKGTDGGPRARPGDPGSPWAIGSPDGGHTAVHPKLGTVEQFDQLVDAAAGQGLEVALDIAFQCSPDHPWVREHPTWFRHLPDGTIRHAENPPKVYEDIYPIDFETEDWRSLWAELATVILFWVDHGVRIFRVDNPHTKSLRFWEWLISSVRAEHPDVIFLSEAFTRPRVMQRLAKGGFSQSYTYFTWRSTKWELEAYLTELHSAPVAEFLRPNLWPNTPDILAVQLQRGEGAAFAVRLVLAATLASSYGIYGPAFELHEHTLRTEGTEDYRHSEKYEIRTWDLDDPSSLAPLVTAVNRARRTNAALQHDRNLRFHRVDNQQLIAYSRHVPGNTVLVVVNLDPDHGQSGWVDLDVEALGLDDLGIADGDPYVAHDLLTGDRYDWRGSRQFVVLDPSRAVAHVLRLETRSGS